MEINKIVLDNNKEYLIVETIVNNDDKYLILTNKENSLDIVIRKVIKKENKEYLVKLDSSEEFEEVITLFNNKYKGMGINEK